MSGLTALMLAALFAAALSLGLGPPTVLRALAPPGVQVAAAPIVATGRTPLARRTGFTFSVSAVVGLVVMLVLPWPAALVSGVVAASMLLRRRGNSRSDDDAVVDRLAEVIDLYAVALLSGHNIVTATRQVASWAPSEFGIWLTWCVEQSQHGRALSDALDELPERLGPAVRPLVAALVANDRYGAPIATSLTLLAADVRGERRRRAEAAARRLPVLLLFPLVVCVLPAFLLLTVVPVVIDTLVAFDL